MKERERQKDKYGRLREREEEREKKREREKGAIINFHLFSLDGLLQGGARDSQ